MNNVHDMGGLPAGAVDRSEHDNSFFEKRVDAMTRLLSHPDRSLIRVDELRRGIESLPEYAHFTYYERWLKSVEILLTEKGVLNADDIAGRAEEIRRRES